MKSIIASVLTCVLLFGISLGVTLYMTEPEDDESSKETSTLNAPEALAKESPPEERSSPGPLELPVALRPKNSISIETILQMSDSIKKTEQQLAVREREVEQKERRVNALLEELDLERDQFKSLAEGVDAKIDLLNRMAADVEKKMNELRQQKSELEVLSQKAGMDDESLQAEFEGRVNEVKNWFAGIPPEQAAGLLREFSNAGKMEFAAALLKAIPDRQKTKILAAINDVSLVNQLIDSLKISPKS